MFAKQIAVMKGQAWNVVETLKTPDHGPLELTRRAKVCVWDDLVDVPVAVPMRLTSSEMRRRAEAEMYSQEGMIEEEMDIGAANSSSSAPPVVVDLLGIASPPADLPHPGRFELSSPSQVAEEPASAPIEGASAISSPVLNRGRVDESKQLQATTQQTQGTNGSASNSRPKLPRPANSHGPPRSLNVYSPERQREHQRRFSFTTAAGRRNSNTIASHLYGNAERGIPRLSYDYGHEVGDDDELEGDLGYAAAEGMEGNQRKVIVERLEPVKTKNPVFTWC